MAARTITAGETLDAWLVGGRAAARLHAATTCTGMAGQPFAEAGMWGIFRVQPTGSSGITPL